MKPRYVEIGRRRSRAYQAERGYHSQVYWSRTRHDVLRRIVSSDDDGQRSTGSERVVEAIKEPHPFRSQDGS